MTTPVRPKTAIQAMRENLQWLRANGASVDEQKAEMERWKPKIQAANAADARPRGFLENAGGVAEEFASGATLGLSGLVDDAASTALNPNQSFAARRAARRTNTEAFREENPGTALAAGFAGGIATPSLGIGKAIGTAGKGIGAALRRGAGMAAEGALGAGIEGTVRGTDDFTGDAMKRALSTGVRDAFVGAVAAPIVGGTLGAGARGAQRLLDRGKASAGVRAVARGVDGLQQGPAGLYSDKAGELMGSPDVMAADVLPGGARKLRAAMNVSPAGEELAATRLRERGANVGPRLERSLADASGLAPSDIATSARENIERRSRAASPLYDKALGVGDVAPERTAARAARKAMPEGALARMDDAELQDEYMRLVEAQSMDEGEISGLRDTPEFAEYSEMPGKEMREDRRGVLTGSGKQVGDMNRDLAMNAGRVKQRQPRIDALKAEMDRRAGEGMPDFMGGDDAGAMGLDDLLASPIVKSAIAQAKALPQFAKLADTDMRVLDKVYKNLGGKLREAQRAGNGALAHDFGVMQSALRTELADLNPAYGEAVRTFKGDSELNDAYTAGVDLFNRPPGEVKEALRGMEASEREMFKKGVVDAMRQQIGTTSPNPDLGTAARQTKSAGQVGVDKYNARARLREVFGDKGYLDLVKAARQEGAFSETAAGALQNSTTAKQLADMGVFGSLADDAAGSLSLSPSATAGNMFVRGLRRATNTGARLLNESGNREAADLLTRPGRGNVEAIMAQVKEELGRREAARQTGQQVATRSARGARTIAGDR